MPQEKLFFRCEGTIDPITETIEIQTVECPESQKWEQILRNRLIRRRWAISVRKLFLWFLLVGFGAVFAGLYGALHNQISYTVAPEYFTVIKFSQLGIEPQTFGGERQGAAIVGVFSTWWVGAFAAVVLGFAGMIYSEKMMLRRVLHSFCIVLLTAIVFDLLGLAIGLGGLGTIINEIHAPAAQLGAHVCSAGIMHDASYLGGAVGLLLGIINLYRK